MPKQVPLTPKICLIECDGPIVLAGRHISVLDITGVPSEDEQVDVYRQVLSAYDGKPVYMRVLDIGGDKQLPYFPITGEENSALGWRGIRFVLDNSALFMTQLRAMIRAAGGINNLQPTRQLPLKCPRIYTKW